MEKTKTEEAARSHQAVTAYEAMRLMTIILGLCLLVNGVYMVGPWYVILPGSSAFGELAAMSELYTNIVALGMGISGLGMILGTIVKKRKVVSYATWLGVSMYTLIVVTRLVNVGFIPFIWTYQLALVLVAAVVALWSGWR